MDSADSCQIDTAACDPPNKFDGTRPLDIALNYAREGIPVFPCREQNTKNEKGEIKKAKSPYFDPNYLKNGVKDATTDETIIKFLFKKFPNALIGIPMGRPSKLLCIDIDVDIKVNPDGSKNIIKNSTALQLFSNLLNAHGISFNEITRINTPSGGYQVWYRIRDDQLDKVDLLTNKVKDKFHLDIRTNGGYAIAPGSHIISYEKAIYGGDYEQIGEIFEELPDWLLNELLSSSNNQSSIKKDNNDYKKLDMTDESIEDKFRFTYSIESTERGRNILKKTLRNLEVEGVFDDEGKRNSTLFSNALYLFRVSLSGELNSDEVISGLNNLIQHSKNPLQYEEICRVITSAKKYAINDGPYIFKDYNKNIDEYYSNKEINWEDPVLFDSLLGLEPDLSKLQPFIYEWCNAVSIDIQMAPSAALGMTLAAISTVAMRKYVVQTNGTYTEPLCLYVMVVSTPSNRKSRCCTLCSDPIFEIEREENERLNGERIRIHNKRKLIDYRIENLLRQASKEKDENKRKELNDQADSLAESKPDEIDEFIMLSDSSSMEALEYDMSTNKNCMGIITAEGGLFDIISGLYNGQKQPNIDILLKGYSNEHRRVRRKTSKSFDINGAKIAIGILMQPIVQQSNRGSAYQDGRGFTARFLSFIPVSWEGTRDVKAPTVSDTLKEKYRNLIKDIYYTGKKYESVQTLTMTPEATDYWYLIAAKIEQEIKPGKSLFEYKMFAGKLAGTIARVAAIFHLIDCTTKGLDPVNTQISLETLKQAEGLAQVFVTNHQALMGLREETGSDTLAKKFLEWFKDKKLEDFTAREIKQSLRRSIKNDENFMAAINILKERKIIKSAKLKREKRSTDGFKVNPLLWKYLPVDREYTPYSENP